MWDFFFQIRIEVPFPAAGFFLHCFRMHTKISSVSCGLNVLPLGHRVTADRPGINGMVRGSSRMKPVRCIWAIFLCTNRQFK